VPEQGQVGKRQGHGLLEKQEAVYRIRKDRQNDRQHKQVEHSRNAVPVVDVFQPTEQVQNHCHGKDTDQQQKEGRQFVSVKAKRNFKVEIHLLADQLGQGIRDAEAWILYRGLRPTEHGQPQDHGCAGQGQPKRYGSQRIFALEHKAQHHWHRRASAEA